MSFKKHCDICNHQKTDLKIGMTCELTGLKPIFKEVCSTISFKNTLQEQLEQINLDLSINQNKKISVHVKFYISISIGFALVLSGILFRKYYSHLFIYDVIDFIIILIYMGISSMSMGYYQLSVFRRNYKIAQTKKNDFDDLLKKYNIEYTSNVIFGSKHHGIQEVVVCLEVRNHEVKETKTTYKIDC